MHNSSRISAQIAFLTEADKLTDRYIRAKCPHFKLLTPVSEAQMELKPDRLTFPVCWKPSNIR